MNASSPYAGQRLTSCLIKEYQTSGFHALLMPSPENSDETVAGAKIKLHRNIKNYE